MLNDISKRNWPSVRKQLQSKKGRQRLVTTKGSYGMTMLSMACGRSPPLDIIELMIDLDPTLALEKDYLDASCLHLACLNGASLPVVKLLVESYPSLVPDIDLDHRTPLHHAVERLCNCTSDSIGDHNALIDVIRMLLDVNPETILWDDKCGNTPSSLLLARVIALERDASSSTNLESEVYFRTEALFRDMQQYSIQVYLQNKKRWEEVGYDTSAAHQQYDCRTDRTIRHQISIISEQPPPREKHRRTFGQIRIGRTVAAVEIA